MKRFVYVVTLVLASSASSALAQDPAKAHANQYHVLIDNARVRVMHVNVPAGAKNALHDHPDHVAVVLTDSSIRFTDAAGKAADVTEKKGDVLYVNAGKHAGENTGKGPLEAIIVEFKGAAGTASVPESRAGMKVTTLVDNPRTKVTRVSADASFSEPAGSKHDYDQVVIPLAPAGMSLTVDGKTKTDWKLGDAAFIGRGVGHESKNTSGKPVEFVIVHVK
jgi:quercetin dioxygenase-like cupin family protein